MEHHDLKHISWNRVFDIIGEPNKTKCWNLYLENHEAIDKARGSKSKHQAWEGGYIDHICECVGIAEKMYETLYRMRPLDFTLAEAALVIFLHDLEKPWKHQIGEEIGGVKVNNKIHDSWKFAYDPQSWGAVTPKIQFCLDMAEKYEIVLSERQRNAVIYAEGEKNDYNPYKRIQSDLAAFVHCCDVISARIWFQYPRVS